MSEAKAPITDAQAAQLIRECDTGDPERDHKEADDILCQLLCQLGFVETVEAFQDLIKWYS